MAGTQGSAGKTAAPSRSTESVRGLRTFALLAGTLSLVGFCVRLLGQTFVEQGGWTPFDFLRNTLEAAIQVAVALGVWFLVGRSELKARLRSVAGALVYVVVGGVAASHDIMGLDYVRFASDSSVVGLIVLIYALLVPARRRHHLILIIISAGYLLGGALLTFALGGYPEAKFGAVMGSAVAMSLPTWGACAVAWFVMLEQERRRRELVDIEDDLAHLGSYTLEKKIGEGGMGEVWQARHAFLARPAALKVIRAQALVGGASAAEAHERARVLITRFEREAQVTAQLTSPHTVQIYDYGRTGHDLFFYVMELLDGLDLWTLVYKYGPQPEERVHHILLQACDSIGEAHVHGLIHRDLKPANLFVCKQGMQQDVTKVLDFGLVKSPAALRGEKTETHMRLTQQGMVSGTPAYMSPEQASGQRDLDGRSDLYALACVAYFLLTGFEIFDSPNPIHVMLGQIERAPVPMRERNPRLQLSADFDAVLNRLLEKNRDRRYADAGALAAALRACRMPRVWDHAAAAAWWDTEYAKVNARASSTLKQTEESKLPSDEQRLLKALRRGPNG